MHKLLALLILSLFSATFAQVNESWKSLPLRDEGRIKPLISFAEGKLLQFSGKSTVYDISKDKKKKVMKAQDWVTSVLFNPTSVDTFKIFLINDPQIQTTLGQEIRDYRLYSYAELDAKRFLLQEQARLAEEVEKEDRSDFHNEIMRINNNILYYEALRKSLEFLRPSKAFTITHPEIKAQLHLAKDEKQFSYFEVYRKAGLLRGALDSLVTKPKEKWSAKDSSAYDISRTLFEWAEINQITIPEMMPFEHDAKWHWLSPWEIMSNRLLNNEILNSEMTWLYKMSKDWTNKDYDSFNLRADSLFNQITSRSKTAYRLEAIKAERLYQKLDPFINAEFIFGLALLLSLIGVSYRAKLFQNLAFIGLFCGTILSIVGIGLRMYINMRPPVTTLFETFVFVGATCGILAIAIGYFKNKEVANLAGNFSALAMLLISNKYAAEGDTLKVLVAVLDSNFWLATHVVTITLGYAGVCASGVVAHVYVLQRLFKKSPEKLDDTFRSMMGMMAFGLVLSFIGTVLGGIWADQSWGRFWGWDPKENGALLIVIWCAMLYHARLAGWLKKPGMVIGNMFGIVVVMLAWFGINLLGVGLHSYGFTSGIAGALLTYIIIQGVIMLLSTIYFKKSGEKLF